MGIFFLALGCQIFAKLPKKFSSKIALKELTELIQSPIHEVRLCGLIILVNQYKKGNFSKIFEYYIVQINFINNWDLVDSSAPYIVGDYLYNNPDERSILFEFVHSENLWVRRISIVSTFTLIKNNQFNETLQIAKILLNDKHDLIHKAVGWMLREVYKRDQDLIRTFLKQNYSQLPRTTLRYAIERMDEVERLLISQGIFS